MDAKQIKNNLYTQHVNNYNCMNKIYAQAIAFILVNLLVLYPFGEINAQIFTEQAGISLTGVSGSTQAWGDYDNDGDLDLLIAGYTGSANIVELYKNNGDNTFTKTTNTFAVNILYDAAWGDYDNDGDLDLLLASTLNSKLYDNNGNGTFTLKASLPEVFMGKCTWADLNNDGFCDIILTGSGGTHILKNNKNGTFTNQTTSIPTVSNYSSVAFGDYDNDGDLDILIAGLSSAAEITKIFRNDLNFLFTEQTSIVLPGISNCDVKWADMDNDGDLDIVISGAAYNFYTKIYENSGSNSFTELAGTSFQELYRTSIDIADYDNDGYRDIILSGSEDGDDQYTCIYHNNKNKTYTKIVGETIPGVQFGSVRWGDYDNDGRLDLFICGNASGGKIAKIFKNNTPNANTAPDVISNHRNTYNPKDMYISFAWDKGTKGGVSQNGLTYNLYIYRVGDTNSTRSSESFNPGDAKNGRRLVAKMGNIQYNSFKYRLYNLTDGNYVWSVQAVDAGLQGGPFSSETTVPLIAQNIFSYQAATPIDSVYHSAVSWADYNNDGYQDFLLTGGTLKGEYLTKLYKNNGTGGFAWQADIVLPGIAVGSVDWADYNNDNNLDFLLTGNTKTGPITKLYKNNGNGTFSEETKAILPAVGFSSVAWGDFNNDGAPDILITGSNAASKKTSQLFKNNKDGSFSALTSLALPKVDLGAVAWCDYNNDGNADFILTGNDENEVKTCYLYKNNGNETFTKNDQSFPGKARSTVAWSDYNNDGLPDLALAGNDALDNNCLLFKNNGDETFTQQTNVNFAYLANGSLSWGDYNNDGYSDLLVLGDYTSVIYRNNAGANFNFILDNLPRVNFGNPLGSYSDYDHDGKLDIVLTGVNNMGKTIGGIYKNIGPYPGNTAPIAPSNLQQTVLASTVTLSWNKASDKQTAQNGLSYNIYIKNADNGTWIKSPSAIVTGPIRGQRSVTRKGDIHTNTPYVICNLPSGTYKWSVQSVDGAFAGSEFAAESSFTVVLGSEIAVNVAENKLMNTRTDLEYSINSTNGTDGTWQVCTSPNTNVNYGNGGFDVWVRSASSPSVFTKLATIAPPAAAPAFTINFTGENTNEIASPGASYSLKADMTDAVTISETKVPLVPGKVYYIRIKTTATALASNIQELSVPERPAKPSFSIYFGGETTKEVVPATCEYSTSASMTKPTIGPNDEVRVTPGQALYFRVKSAVSNFASEAQILDVPARPAPPVYTIDYANECTNEIFVDYFNSNGAINSWTSTSKNYKFAFTPGQNVYFAKAVSEISFRSDFALFTVPERPLPPTSPIEDDAANTFDWTNNPLFTNAGDYEYSVNNGSTWNVCTAKPVTIGNINAAIGAVRVRIKASSTGFKSNELVSASAFTSTTGINTFSEAGITLFPNPVTDILYIRDAPLNSKISILTIDGSLVKEILSVADKNNIVVSDLPSGIYLIKIKTDNTEIQGKFVKQ